MTVAGVLTLAVLNYRGVTKTAVLTRILVGLTLLALTAVVILGSPSAAAPSPPTWAAGPG